jgi:hypothetical protein
VRYSRCASSCLSCARENLSKPRNFPRLRMESSTTLLPHGLYTDAFESGRSISPASFQYKSRRVIVQGAFLCIACKTSPLSRAKIFCAGEAGRSDGWSRCCLRAVWQCACSRNAQLPMMRTMWSEASSLGNDWASKAGDQTRLSSCESIGCRRIEFDSVKRFRSSCHLDPVRLFGSDKLCFEGPVVSRVRPDRIGH